MRFILMVIVVVNIIVIINIVSVSKPLRYIIILFNALEMRLPARSADVVSLFFNKHARLKHR